MFEQEKEVEMKLNYRPAEISDLMFLFNLRNEEAVRLASWNTEPVSLEGHTKWFESSLKNFKRILYLVEADGQPIGQVRFDISENGNSAEISISISENFRGKGVGSQIIYMTSQSVFRYFSVINEIVAHIKVDNYASINAFSRAGYSNPKEVNYEGHYCIEMIAKK